MQHWRRIQQAVDFIEHNLHGAFTLSDVSKAAFSSLSYMHRIFYQMTGFTMKEYIRKRRLSVAALQLVDTTASVLAIGLEAGFDSAESFCRAFKQQFGVSPRAHRHSNAEITLLAPLDVDEQFTLQLDQVVDFVLQLESVQYRACQIQGFQTHTTLENSQQVVDICAFSNRIVSSGLLAAHFDLKQTNVFGIYTNMNDSSDFDYSIACLKKSCHTSHPDMVSHQIEDGLYAKFRLNRLDRIKEAWHYIYGRWFPAIEAFRRHGYDFEIYHADHVSIYIPMTKMPKV